MFCYYQCSVVCFSCGVNEHWVTMKRKGQIVSHAGLGGGFWMTGRYQISSLLSDPACLMPQPEPSIDSVFSYFKHTCNTIQLITSKEVCLAASLCSTWCSPSNEVRVFLQLLIKRRKAMWLIVDSSLNGCKSTTGLIPACPSVCFSFHIPHSPTLFAVIFGP